MSTITLTEGQEWLIAAPYIVERDKAVAQAEAKAAKAYTALQRRTDTRIDKAKQETTEWKQRYNETRKQLIAARTEIIDLKRRLRNGKWE